MKKTVAGILIIVALLFVLTGCGSEEEKKDIIEANEKVGVLSFYVPEEFSYRKDLRGLMYDESQKKVFVNGDYNNDPDNTIVLVAYYETIGKDAKQYTDEINAKLSNTEIKYEIKSNGKITDIYAREKYKSGKKTNYAYILDKDEKVYVVNVVGPKDKAEQIAIYARKVFSSLELNKQTQQK